MKTTRRKPKKHVRKRTHRQPRSPFEVHVAHVKASMTAPDRRAFVELSKRQYRAMSPVEKVLFNFNLCIRYLDADLFVDELSTWSAQSREGRLSTLTEHADEARAAWTRNPLNFALLSLGDEEVERA